MAIAALKKMLGRGFEIKNGVDSELYKVGGEYFKPQAPRVRSAEPEDIFG